MILWYVLEGLSHSFITRSIELLGFIVSFVSALKLYSFFSYLLVDNFSIPKGIADASGFFIAGTLGEIIFSTIANFLTSKIPHKYLDNKFNRFLGIIPSLINGVIIIAFILTILVALPINPKVKSAILSSKLSAPVISKTQNLEQQINSIFGGAVTDTLTFLTVKPQGDETVNLNFTTNELSIDPSSEQAMLNMVNEERKKMGIKTLTFDSSLQAVARNHATDMFKRGYFSHNSPEGTTPFDRMKNADITYETAGENLALTPNVEIAHTGLMNSPGHKANILNVEFGKVGIGVIDGGVYGKMFVQEFTN